MAAGKTAFCRQESKGPSRPLVCVPRCGNGSLGKGQRPSRRSMASISMPVMETSKAASISRMQVGLVTLISVRRSPMMSRPTKMSPSLSGSGLPRGRWPSPRHSRARLTTAAGRQVATGLTLGRNAGQAVRCRFTVHHQHPLVAILDGGQIGLRHAVLAAVRG